MITLATNEVGLTCESLRDDIKGYGVAELEVCESLKCQKCIELSRPYGWVNLTNSEPIPTTQQRIRGQAAILQPWHVD